MLPFLNQKRNQDGGSVSISHDGKISSGNDMGLMSAAEDLVRAIHSKDHKAVAAALKAAFQILDAEPHVEGPHEEE